MPTKPHEFDGVQACGKWIIAEQVDAKADPFSPIAAESRIHAPESARIAVWRVISVGSQSADLVKVGDRILFRQCDNQLDHHGRKFSFLYPEQIIAVMAPYEFEAPLIAPAPSVRLVQ